MTAHDKLHNGRAVLDDYRRIGAMLWDRFSGGHADTVWDYRALADEIARGGPASIAPELDHAVIELEELVRAAGPDFRRMTRKIR